MDAFRRLKVQVSKQQQAVRKQFYGISDSLVTNKSEIQQRQTLEKLYASTRSAKNFQRDIVRSVEGYVAIGSKQVDIGNKLSEESMKFGVDDTCTSGNTLSKAALSYARARALIEKEHGDFLKFIATQVAEPLRAMIMGAALEDARQLAKQYDKMLQEAETQAIEVSKRQQRAREASGNADNISKLEAAESKLQELKSNMDVLLKEAIAAMTAVETYQQKLTSHLLLAMIEAEQTYHKRTITILEQLEREITSDSPRSAASPRPSLENPIPPPPSYDDAIGVGCQNDGSAETVEYFLAEVLESYHAETDIEINLSVGDYVVVRKVSSNGWAEGECKGKAGWFPFEYIERRERVPVNFIWVVSFPGEEEEKQEWLQGAKCFARWVCRKDS